MVRHPSRRRAALCLGAAFFAAAPSNDAGAQCPIEELDVTALQVFPDFAWVGQTLDLSGDVLVTSSFRERIHPIEVIDPTNGAVYVHRLSDGVWSLEERIVFQGLNALDNFAYEVAVEGDVLAVGIPSGCTIDPLPGVCPPGRVAVYERDSRGWQLVDVLLPSGSAIDDEFGISADLQGGRLLVGAPNHVVAANTVGAAYVFERIGGEWTEVAALAPDPPLALRLFGEEVALDGDVAAIVAPGIGLGGSDGALFVFERAGGVWSQTARLELPIWNNGFGNFRVSVSVSGERIALGAPRAGQVHTFPTPVIAGVQNGGVRVIEKVGGEWTVVDTLFSADPTEGALFGSSVDLDGERLAVGASRDAGAKTLTGAAYLFERTPLGWAQTAEILDPAAQGNTKGIGERFGFTVALDGDQFAAGAPFADLSGKLDAGAIYPASVADLPCAGQSLFGAPRLLSLAEGGAQVLHVQAGGSRAGHVYWMLGSATGTAPGLDLPPLGVHLPLAVDAWFGLTISLANTPPLVATVGLLDGEGRGTARFEIPGGVLGGDLVAASLFHAALVIDPVTFEASFASGAARLTFVP